MAAGRCDSELTEQSLSDPVRQLLRAARAGSVSVLSALLHCGDAAALAAARNDAGRTALLVAAAHGHVECVRALVACGADPLAVDSAGHTGLHLAARSGHSDTIALLCGYGVDVNAQLLASRRTALHIAAHHGFKRCIELLLAHGADCSLVDSSHRLALHGSALGVEPLLLPAGLDRLLDAVSSGEPARVRAVLAAEGAGRLVNAQDRSGWTPLMEAVALRQPEVVAELLRWGADPHQRDQMAAVSAALYALTSLGDAAVFAAMGVEPEADEMEVLGLYNSTAAATGAGLLVAGSAEVPMASAWSRRRRTEPADAPDSPQSNEATVASDALQERLSDSLEGNAAPAVDAWLQELRARGYEEAEPLHHFLARIGRDAAAWAPRGADNPPMPVLLANLRRWVVRQVLAERGRLGGAPEDMAAVHAYTLCSDLYRLPNRCLREGDAAGLQRWRPFIAHLAGALARARWCVQDGAWVYRGVGVDLAAALPQYAVGATVTWHAFSSASCNWQVARTFLTSGAGAVFVIWSRTGRRIFWSFYPEEKEVLFLPGTRFCVTALARLSSETLEFPGVRHSPESQLSVEEAVAERAVLVEMVELV